MARLIHARPYADGYTISWYSTKDYKWHYLVGTVTAEGVTSFAQQMDAKVKWYDKN